MSGESRRAPSGRAVLAADVLNDLMLPGEKREVVGVA
jgi:hypothetical protein